MASANNPLADDFEFKRNDDDCAALTCTYRSFGNWAWFIALTLGALSTYAWQHGGQGALLMVPFLVVVFVAGFIARNASTRVVFDHAQRRVDVTRSFPWGVFTHQYAYNDIDIINRGQTCFVKGKASAPQASRLRVHVGPQDHAQLQWTIRRVLDIRDGRWTNAKSLPAQANAADAKVPDLKPASSGISAGGSATAVPALLSSDASD